MSDIYMMPVTTQITRVQYDQLLHRVSTSKAKDVQQYFFRLDALRSLAGEVMVRHIILQSYNVKNDDLHFSKNTYGKPFVEGIPSFHFNISHAGKWVVCAIDNNPIGIDIEQKEKIDLQIANRFFSETEANDLFEQPVAKQTDYFFQLWTLKESYIKMIGKGLHIPLNSFSCRIQSNNMVTFHADGNADDVYLKLFEPDAHYKMALCQMHDGVPSHIHHLTMDDILETT